MPPMSLSTSGIGLSQLVDFPTKQRASGPVTLLSCLYSQHLVSGTQWILNNG